MSLKRECNVRFSKKIICIGKNDIEYLLSLHFEKIGVWILILTEFLNKRSIRMIVTFVLWKKLLADAKQWLNVVFVVQGSMWNQNIVQSLTPNPKSLNAKWAQNTQDNQEDTSWFSDAWTGGCCSAPLRPSTETQSKDDDPLPCMLSWEYRFAWKPLNSPAKDQRSLEQVCKQTRTNKHFVWKLKSDFISQYQNVN